MKKIILNVVTLLIAGSFFSTINAQDDISNIFKAGVADLNTVANGYLKPAGVSFSTGLGSNWYNTAAVHKTWGFDLTVGVGVVQASQADQMFSLTGLTNLKPTVTGTTQAPSFAGKGPGVELNLMQPHYMSDGTTVNPLWNNGTGKITSFTTPAGVSQYVPTANVQFTIGLPYINDVSVRFVPKVSVSGFEASMWGVGVKHNFKQWIPVVKDLPFDASVLLAYNIFNVKYAFPTSAQITPDKLVGSNLTYDSTPTDYTTQGMVIKASAMTANLIFSKKLAFITPYIGFGIIKSNFDLTMAGNYPTLGNPKTTSVTVGGTTTVVPVYRDGKPVMEINNMTDPIKITSPEVMTNATVGIRMKVLWVLSIHAQYAFQKYPIASAGFGITIR